MDENREAWDTEYGRIARPKALFSLERETKYFRPPNSEVEVSLWREIEDSRPTMVAKQQQQSVIVSKGSQISNRRKARGPSIN